MAVTIRGHGQVVRVRSESWDVSVRSPEKFKMGVETGILVASFPDYEGTYEVTPTMGEQVLPSRARTMRDDVTVHAIPYTQTTNESGGYTAIIAAS